MSDEPTTEDTTEDAATEEAATEDAATEDAATEGTASEETASEGAASEEAASEEAATGVTPPETSSEESAAKEVGKPEGDKGDKAEESISPLTLIILVAILAVVVYSFVPTGDPGANLPESNDPKALLAEGHRIASSDGLKEAVPYFAKAVKVDPSNVEANAALGFALLRLQRAGEAISHLELCRDREPERFEFQLRYGMCLADLKKFKQSRAALEQAKKLKPDALEPQFRLGIVCTFLGDNEAVVSHLEPFVGVSKDPGKKAFAYQLLSQAQRNLGRREDAVATLSSLTILQPGNVTARLTLQRQQIAVFGFDETLRLAGERAEQKDGTHLDSYLYGTLLASHPDRAADARAWLEKALEQGPEAWLAPRLSLAQEDLRDNAVKAARQRLDEVIKLSPKHFAAKLLLADLEWKAKNLQQAREIYEVVLSSPEAPRALRSILGTYLDEGKADQAMAFARRAPPGEARMVLEATALQRLGRWDESKKLFDALLAKAGKPALQVTWLGYLTYFHLDKGDLAAARDAFTAMEKKAPKQAKFPLQFYVWAGIAFKDTDLPRAKKYWQRGAETKKDYELHAWKRRACERLLGRGDPQKLLNATRLAPFETENDALYLEAVALELAGKPAKEAYERAMKVSAPDEFPARLIARALKQ